MEKYHLSKKIIKILLFVISISAIIGFLVYQNSNQSNPYNCKDCNIVFISIDSLRADHLGIYGYYRNTTPNIDNLAKEGILFENHFSNAYLTMVSQLTIFTGLYPSTHGLAHPSIFLQNDNLIANPSDYPNFPTTLPEVLQLNGYETSAYVNSPELREFKIFFKGFNYFNYTEVNASGITNYRRSLPNLDDWFQKKHDKFFLFIALGTVHAPYIESPTNLFEDPNYTGIFKDKNLNLCEILSIYNYTYYPINDNCDTKVGAGIKLNQQDMQYVIDRYDNRIYYVDQFLGDFFNKLKASGYDKNTIIVLTSEHGEELGEHGYVMHYDIYDPEIHVPLIIKVPGGKPEVISQQTQHLDLLPTVLDILKITIPAEVQGRSMLSLINGTFQGILNNFIYVERVPIWEEFANYSILVKPDSFRNELHEDIGLRNGDWMLIHRETAKFLDNSSWYAYLNNKTFSISDYELFNVKTDPLEIKNVAVENTQVFNQLKDNLDSFEKWLSIHRAPINVVVVNSTFYPYP